MACPGFHHQSVTAMPSSGSSHVCIQCAVGRLTIARLMYSPNGVSRYSSTGRTSPLLSMFTRAGTSNVETFGGCTARCCRTRPGRPGRAPQTVGGPRTLDPWLSRQRSPAARPNHDVPVAHSEFRPVGEIPRTGGRFEVVSPHEPAGDQPAAIEELERRITAGEQDVVLLGATGTGKSATTAWLIERVQRPTLVMAPNKTLAAQLANELREMLPNNAVEYFVSYYDYYQPEAYIAQTDTYIEKDSSINEDVERLRHSATMNLLSRRDVVVVASVSCIYGLGTPQSYLDRSVKLKVGGDVERDALLRALVDVQYTRNDLAFTRGTFRVRGDTVEIIPAYEELALRIEFFGDEVEALYYLHPLTGEVLRQVDELRIFPATHYVAGPERMERAVRDIEAELAERLAEFESQGKLLEAQRLKLRTEYDMEMIRQVGFCSGIENYSRHIDGRGPGTAPATLIDYFPDDFLLVIDESHQTVPQIGGMYEGDMSRKRNLVEFGFRLPSAVDNRPLTWEEFADRIGQTVYLSATPGPYELTRTGGEFVEQVIRPTGLVDPKVVVKPTKGQIDDLVHEIRARTERDERVLVTTLTKKMAEDLTDYLLELGIRVRYLHSEVDTLRRVELLRQLRLGEFDVLVGINLLREGLDLPEVSLVAILDADKEGFLRSGTSLIQTIGRAARNVSGEVHMYADKVTESMQYAIDETDRRRAKQVAYNEERGSIRSRCGRRSPTSSTRSTARPRSAGRRLGPQPVARQAGRGRARPRPHGRSSGIVAGRDTKSMPRAELADLVQQLSDQMLGRRPRPAVRAGRPAARRDRRPEEGAARHGRGGDQVRRRGRAGRRPVRARRLPAVPGARTDLSTSPRYREGVTLTDVRRGCSTSSARPVASSRSRCPCSRWRW